jgi:hypothetical protein
MSILTTDRNEEALPFSRHTNSSGSILGSARESEFGKISNRNINSIASLQKAPFEKSQQICPPKLIK